MSNPNPITLETVIDVLNDALSKDQDAITELFNYRVRCNSDLADHPTIQVGRFPIAPEEFEHRVGVLGILNGLLGVRDDEWGYLSAVYDKPGGKIVRFEETSREIRRQA